MQNAQKSIFTEGFRHHYALELKLRQGASDQDFLLALRTALSNGLDNPPQCAVGFGPDLWKRLSPDQVPADLTSFQAIKSPVTVDAPASQGDLWLWFKNNDPSSVFDAALIARNALIDTCEVILSQPGFIYYESMDLMGFEDGTANPKEDDRFPAALVASHQPGADGSIVFTQKWVHNLPKFNALDDDEQGRVIGRTKYDNEELEGDDMPDDSHVSRTDVKIDGVAQKIWRQSFPFGTTEEHGLYFLSFACETQRIQVQLDRMFGIADDGLYDRITEFSTPVTGAYWFAPSQSALDRLIRP
ncbi:Dyp-type peroxidase [Aestuariispira insulae]|uniref:Putative iron-dependent peroxidase n=1 Tax=Aestuariispira insulae TaxID=1461337 RepID=A0A3D9H584_9PROT|nr:Dyp-type peroxidase [Aestuariispira insulae]RED44673.1 putative iron-dependent peroxidase [Aestuariispira insulae]